MRPVPLHFLALAFALALSGCSLPQPAPQGPSGMQDVPAAMQGAPPADPAWTSAPMEESAWWTWNTTTMLPDPADDTWIARWTPGNVTGAPGELARVRVDVRPARADAPAARFLVPPWARAADPSAQEFEVTAEGAAFDLDVLVGPRAALQITILSNESDGVCCRQAFLHGPRIGVLGNATFAPVVATPKLDEADVPDGLSAVATEGGALVTWSFGRWESDCSASAVPLGDFVVEEREGERTLVGFVEAWSSDACMVPAPVTTPRVEARAIGLDPGALRVLVFSHQSQLMIPPGWVAEEARVAIPGASQT
ncbi:MAG TPA: hypothetical protein VM370_07030 [Candidatus Thermoplasmatota archaeon]|nr:hypothetical protein [Candidatus Thermoplasmatota archaeon]